MSGARTALYSAGPSPQEAAAVVVLVHGRGASGPSILGLADAFGHDDVAYLAPEAGGGSWYPHSFLAPIEANEPGLSRGVDAIGSLVRYVDAAEIPRERVVLGGFSQGACLALEAAARLGGPWGGGFAFSGGLIGTGPGPADAPRLAGMGGRYAEKAFDYDALLDGTPVFLGCSDVDPHIPLARVRTTADVFARLGAEVDLRVYPGFGHTVNDDEIAAVSAMLDRLVGSEF
ncbi:MAG: phospholipase [Bacteroidota bacterium]